MTDIINALAAGLYSKLQGGTALTSLLSGTTAIYHNVAPDNATLPYVIFSVQGGGDENQSPNRTQNLVLFVRGYSGNSQAQAGSIDTQIDNLLHMQTVTVSGWTNIWTARESSLTMPEPQPNGGYVYMSGGYYRIRLD